MALDINMVLIYGFGIILLFIIGRAFLMPMKIISKLVLNTLLGAAGLFIINYIGGFFGFHIALNIVTALITGFLGVPGVVLLILLKSVFGI